jgi:hypothetical protein
LQKDFFGQLETRQRLFGDLRLEAKGRIQIRTARDGSQTAVCLARLVLFWRWRPGIRRVGNCRENDSLNNDTLPGNPQVPRH